MRQLFSSRTMTAQYVHPRLEVVYILFSVIFITCVTGICEFNLNQNVSNEPLLLHVKKDVSHNSYELIYLKQCKLQLDPTQDILLACPGKENYLNLTKDSWNIVKCDSLNKFKVNETIIPYWELNCNTKPKADFKITGRKCLKNKGNIINIGFNVVESWHPLIEICHDIQKDFTYYVKHSLIIPNSPCEKTPITRPNFIEGGGDTLFSDVKMSKIYSTTYQYELFKNLTEAKASNYINRGENKFLARGHLAPDADFPLDAWKSLTYYYLNTAPQWQSINSGKWSSLETKIRTLSRKVEKLSVFTGTHGIMKIEKKDLYLFKKKVPVPEYFWKLVHNPEENTCMGFISKNNPFLQRYPRKICQDVCSRYNWNMTSGNLFHGMIYCCEYHQLTKVIEEVPSSIKCRSALRFM